MSWGTTSLAREQHAVFERILQWVPGRTAVCLVQLKCNQWKNNTDKWLPLLLANNHKTVWVRWRQHVHLLNNSAFVTFVHSSALSTDSCQISEPRLEMWANAQRGGCAAEYRWHPLFNTAKFGWRRILECRAVTLPRRDTRWNLLGCPKLVNWSQPLVGRSSPYYQDTWRRYCCLTSFFRLSICNFVAKI